MYTLRGDTEVTPPDQWLSIGDADIDIIIPVGDDMLPYELRSTDTETATDSDTGLQHDATCETCGIRQRQQAVTDAAPDSQGEYAIVPVGDDMLPHMSASFDSKMSADSEIGLQQQETADGVSEVRLQQQAVTADASEPNKRTGTGVTSIGKPSSAIEDTRRPAPMTAGPADHAVRHGNSDY